LCIFYDSSRYSTVYAAKAYTFSYFKLNYPAKPSFVAFFHIRLYFLLKVLFLLILKDFLLIFIILQDIILDKEYLLNRFR